MFTATFKLTGIAPLGWTRRIVIPKNENESDRDWETRIFRERFHATTRDELFIPPLAVKYSLDTAAQYAQLKVEGGKGSFYTKHFQSGVMCSAPFPIVLPNGKQATKEDLEPTWLFVSPTGKRGGRAGSRVDKCFPRLDEWWTEGSLTVVDEKITEEVFKKVLRKAGLSIGIGYFRPQNQGFWGRFEITEIHFDLDF